MLQLFSHFSVCRAYKRIICIESYQRFVLAEINCSPWLCQIADADTDTDVNYELRDSQTTMNEQIANGISSIINKHISSHPLICVLRERMFILDEN